MKAAILFISMPHWIVAFLIPLAAFYLVVFAVAVQGWLTTAFGGLYLYQYFQFWIYYVLPCFFIIALAGWIFPDHRRVIDWGFLAFLFLGIYMLAPRISA